MDNRKHIQMHVKAHIRTEITRKLWRFSDRGS